MELHWRGQRSCSSVVCTKLIHRTPFCGLRSSTGMCRSKWIVFPRPLDMRRCRHPHTVWCFRLKHTLHSTHRATPGVTHTDGRFISRRLGYETVQSGTLLIRRRDILAPIFIYTQKTTTVYSIEPSLPTYQTIRRYNNPHRRDGLKILKGLWGGWGWEYVDVTESGWKLGKITQWAAWLINVLACYFETKQWLETQS